MLLCGLYLSKVNPQCGSTAKTAKSVTIICTHLLPVRGRSHLSLIFDFPYLSTWVWTTTTRVFAGFETRSYIHQYGGALITNLKYTMAPPIPLTILFGTMKLARSPYWLTSSAYMHPSVYSQGMSIAATELTPRTVISKCPPRI
jgi:hypothetical protein